MKRSSVHHVVQGKFDRRHIAVAGVPVDPRPIRIRGENARQTGTLRGGRRNAAMLRNIMVLHHHGIANRGYRDRRDDGDVLRLTATHGIRRYRVDVLRAGQLHRRYDIRRAGAG